MKQIYASGNLPTNMSFTPAEDAHVVPLESLAPSVRANSQGVTFNEQQLALSFGGYAPPPASFDQPERKLPIRLALLGNSTTGRMLTHVAPNGTTYFAHTLLDVPNSADAQSAIQTWGSPLWQRYEPENAGELPELPYLPVADVLDDSALKDWLSSPIRRDLLEYVLAALLTTPATTRITLAAAAEDVAKIVYAVTRCLPSSLLNDFTFSTYEADPLACAARLVGHDTGSPTIDLPDACYAGSSVAYNPTIERKTTLRNEVPFAEFAVNALANAEFSQLDDLHSTWHRLGLHDASQFDLVFRLARGTGVMTKDEALQGLQHPPLAAWISAREDALKQFLDWALEDRQFASLGFGRVLQALRQKASTIAKLGENVRRQGMDAIRSGETVKAANALEIILPMTTPSKAQAVWGEVISEFSDPDKLNWETRCFLLPRLIRFKQQAGVKGIAPELTPWITVPSEKLGELLKLELPRPYPLQASRISLKNELRPSTELTQTLGQHPNLTLRLLQPEDVNDSVEADRLVTLFETLLRETPTHAWFENLLANADHYPTPLLNRFFEAILATGQIDADRLIRSRGDELLRLFAGQSGLERIGSQFLLTSPADVLNNPNIGRFLDTLGNEPSFSVELKKRISAIHTVRAYSTNPTFTTETMKPVAAAFEVTPPVLPSNTKLELFGIVAGELATHAENSDFQADFERVLVELGPVLANEPADMYENLLREIRSRTDVFRKPTLLSGFLAVALGAHRNMELDNKLDGLDVQAFALANECAKRGGANLLRELDKRSEEWPKAARTQWNFLAAAVRPRGAMGLVRDAGLILAGAVVASVVWAIVTLM